jgi:hypothetical protein
VNAHGTLSGIRVRVPDFMTRKEPVVAHRDACLET